MLGGREGALRAKMHQTHAVRHRQYTFEEKSRRSFCPDGGGGGRGNKQTNKKKQYVELKEQKMNRVHVKTKRRR